ncbi:MAG: cyclodeaminase/cyclohydrolase family protein, partial [Acidobacteriota bacterium]
MDFLAVLSKPNPTPAGGSAAAYAGAVAASLLEKIVRIEVRRKAISPEEREA